jgi:hypothetical protein
VPLAIELAAARVRTLSVEQIAARLADRFGLLTTGNRTAPPRQRTLRAAMDWSYELLSASEQVLLRRLSVFVGWSLEMAEQVCSDDDIPASDVLDLLDSLMDKSLAVREPEVLGQARYRLIDTIREYAAVRLADAGETAAFQHRLRDYTVTLAEHNLAIGMARVAAPWSARVDVFRRYDVDGGNVAQVLGHCLAEGDAETGLRLCTAVRPCWIVRGTFTEGGEWLDSLLAIDAPADSRGSGAPPWWGARSSPCPVPRPWPSPGPRQGWSCAAPPGTRGGRRPRSTFSARSPCTRGARTRRRRPPTKRCRSLRQPAMAGTRDTRWATGRRSRGCSADCGRRSS